MLTQLSHNQQGRLPNWLGVIIIIIALVVIAFLLAWLNQPTEPTGPTPSQISPPAQVQEFHTVAGNIVAVTKNQIQILVPAIPNKRPDKIYRVNFDESTVITKRQLPESLEPGEPVIVNAEPGDVTELVTNVDVIVTTEVDIAGVDEFFATSIELRN